MGRRSASVGTKAMSGDGFDRSAISNKVAHKRFTVPRRQAASSSCRIKQISLSAFIKISLPADSRRSLCKL